eukprot:TRINITY_DN16651_c0_g1_i1.p1 TRINITY_DN16651_c0_g1~~TRINITY_DN16651_c0_g1_i1.p1  ORF type:complete len:204 (-),score=57.74 TRINITY_DN16651_c0_g1_i1:58-669(-)
MCIRDSYKDNESKNPAEQKLKFIISEVALDLYVKFAGIDCTPFINSAVDWMSESSGKEKRLRKSFYIMICLLLKKRIPFSEFQKILNESPQHLLQIPNLIKESPEVTCFLKANAIDALFDIYRGIAYSFAQLVERLNDYEKEMENLYGPESPSSVNAHNNVAESYNDILEDINHVRRIMGMIESFIYVLHHSCLLYTSPSPRD